MLYQEAEAPIPKVQSVAWSATMYIKHGAIANVSKMDGYVCMESAEKSVHVYRGQDPEATFPLSKLYTVHVFQIFFHPLYFPCLMPSGFHAM